MNDVTRSLAHLFTICLCTTSTLSCFIDTHRFWIHFLFLYNTSKSLFLHHAKFHHFSLSHFDSRRFFHNINTFLIKGFRVSITYTCFGLPRNFSEVKFVLLIRLCDAQRMFLGIEWRKNSHKPSINVPQHHVHYFWVGPRMYKFVELLKSDNDILISKLGRFINRSFTFRSDILYNNPI